MLDRRSIITWPGPGHVASLLLGKACVPYSWTQVHHVYASCLCPLRSTGHHHRQHTLLVDLLSSPCVAALLLVLRADGLVVSPAPVAAKSSQGDFCIFVLPATLTI